MRTLERWNVGYCGPLQNSDKSSWRACSNRIGLRVRTRLGYTFGNGTRILWRSLKDFEGDGWYLVQESMDWAARGFASKYPDGMHVTILHWGKPREVIAPAFRVLIRTVVSVCEIVNRATIIFNYFLNKPIAIVVKFKFYLEIFAIFYLLTF